MIRSPPTSAADRRPSFRGLPRGGLGSADHRHAGWLESKQSTGARPAIRSVAMALLGDRESRE